MKSAVQRIVVVDDESLICAIIEDFLGDSGADVRAATTGKAGAEMLTGEKFDLALIDIVLPDVSGIALAEIAATERTPVLLMTGHPDATLRLRCFDFPCLEKPFDLDRLSTGTAQVIADGNLNVQRVMRGIAKLRANLETLGEAMPHSRPLIEVSLALVDKALTLPGS